MTDWTAMGPDQFDRRLGTAKERRLAARLREQPDTLLPELAEVAPHRARHQATGTGAAAGRRAAVRGRRPGGRAVSAAGRALAERVRAELAATAERERIADVVVKDAMREWRDAKNAHRAAGKAYDAARRRGVRAHPSRTVRRRHNRASLPGHEEDMMTGYETILAEYEQHLARSPLRGHSPRTYLSVVRSFLAWLEAADVDGDPLNDPVAWSWAVRDYRTWLVTVRKLAPATINKALSALDDFGTWRGLGKPRGNGERGVKRQEIPQRAPRALEPRAAIRFLRAVEACPSARDRAIALVPLYGGARIAEVARLDVEDVRLSARKGELRLIGKGEKSRTVPVHAKLREALAAWLAERPSWPGSETPALFLGRRGTRLTTDAIGDVIEAITRAAGLDDHVTVHTLRHTFGTSLVRDGVDLVTVAQLMGHARLETTRAYTQPSQADLERAIASLPVDE